ncbi:MAG: histidinol dehydrogenase, partial [Thermodesulfatator sp.]
MAKDTIIKPLEAESPSGREGFSALLQRQFEIPADIEAAVREIIQAVRKDGDAALLHYTAKFDCPEFDISMLRVSEAEISAAYDKIDPKILKSLRKALENIKLFHGKQRPNSWFDTREDGIILGQMVRPVDAAGLYVPGGTGGSTPLVSSVLMNAVPARIAGVKRLLLATPPGRDGKISPYLLVAAQEAGVSEIYRMGSAWAIAAMAYGTQTIKPVDVIAGPGNIFVTVAKKIISGTTGIDMVAGPSEILIIADESADPAYVAADMLSQAEHDPMATSVLITTSMAIAEQTCSELSIQAETLQRSETAIKSIESNGLVLVVKDLEKAAAMTNRVGPEHLELFVENPWELLPLIHHAGAIFLGAYSPEPVGDYIAGPNHVLPTMGTARFSSALGVETFLKRSSIISYSEKAFFQD